MLQYNCAHIFSHVQYFPQNVNGKKHAYSFSFKGYEKQHIKIHHRALTYPVTNNRFIFQSSPGQNCEQKTACSPKRHGEPMLSCGTLICLQILEAVGCQFGPCMQILQCRRCLLGPNMQILPESGAHLLIVQNSPKLDCNRCKRGINTRIYDHLTLSFTG